MKFNVHKMRMEPDEIMERPAHPVSDFSLVVDENYNLHAHLVVHTDENKVLHKYEVSPLVLLHLGRTIVSALDPLAGHQTLSDSDGKDSL